jgi:hypothetical protein
MKRSFVISFILLSALVFECESDIKSDCATSICTLEFRIINILIKKSSDNSPVVLTDFKVIRISDNKDITINDNNLNDNSGYYPLVNDNGIAMLRNINVEIEFHGYINDALIINKRLVVTADCCHVSLVSGESVVYL